MLRINLTYIKKISHFYPEGMRKNMKSSVIQDLNSRPQNTIASKLTAFSRFSVSWTSI